ncbi:MAG: hypothetical protein MUF45_17720 [Spirosomaceae bacterium]|jgi:hypothetical protein|nr:hypothetical protein [Spirosomataceae bacterium]
MFSSSILDTLIALVFVYFMFSTLVSCTIEYYAQKTKRRAIALKEALNKILNDHINLNFASLLYAHPLVKEFREKENKLPSYLDGNTFAKALIDIIAKQSPETQDLLKDFRSGVNTLKEGDVKTLLNAFGVSCDTIDDLEKQIQTWYDGYMDRVTGWYKKGMRTPLLIGATIYVIIFNINFIDIAKYLYVNESVRNAIVSDAITATQKDTIKFSPANIDSLQKKLTNDYILPIGWNLAEEKEIGNGGLKQFVDNIKNEMNQKGVGHVFWGWAISAFIMSFGAPFWFDVLKKLVNMRGSGLKTLIEDKTK